MNRTQLTILPLVLIFVLLPLLAFSAEYIIEGNDAGGNYFYGEIEIKKDLGSGFIRTSDGQERKIDLEQTDKGIFVGYDEDGNYFELEFD